MMPLSKPVFCIGPYVYPGRFLLHFTLTAKVAFFATVDVAGRTDAVPICAPQARPKRQALACSYVPQSGRD